MPGPSAVRLPANFVVEVPRRTRIEELCRSTFGETVSDWRKDYAVSIKSMGQPRAGLHAFQYTFECVQDNIFRVTYSSVSHPIPARIGHEKAPKYGFARCGHFHWIKDKRRAFQTGKCQISIDWRAEPIARISFIETGKTVYSDAVGSYFLAPKGERGILHCMERDREAHHVGLDGRNNIISPAGACMLKESFGTSTSKYHPIIMSMTSDYCVAVFSTALSDAKWTICRDDYICYSQEYGGIEQYIFVGRTAADVLSDLTSCLGLRCTPMPRFMMGLIGRVSAEPWASEYTSTAILNRSIVSQCAENDMPLSAVQMEEDGGILTAQRLNTFTRCCHRLGARALFEWRPFIHSTAFVYSGMDKSRILFSTGDTGGSVKGGYIDFTSSAGNRHSRKAWRRIFYAGGDGICLTDNDFKVVLDHFSYSMTRTPAEYYNAGYLGRALQTELSVAAFFKQISQLKKAKRPVVVSENTTVTSRPFAAGTCHDRGCTSWEGMRRGTEVAVTAGFSLSPVSITETLRDVESTCNAC